MSEYTPTTALVRHNYGAYGAPAVDFDRWLAEVRAAVLEEAADALVKLTPYGMELLPDGREDKQAAAYVEGVHTSHDFLRARATQIREEGRA